jgi:hypothetical protein
MGRDGSAPQAVEGKKDPSGHQRNAGGDPKSLESVPLAVSVKGLPECREYGTIAVVKVSRDVDLTNGR